MKRKNIRLLSVLLVPILAAGLIGVTTMAQEKKGKRSNCSIYP